MEENQGIAGYPKIFNLGNKYVKDIFKNAVFIQEKIDGSQISWSVDDNHNLMIRSKGAVINPDMPPDIFAPSVASIKRMYHEGHLAPGVIYRGEAMRGPRHNTLIYERAPKNNIVLFDVQFNDGVEAHVNLLPGIAESLGIEVTPLLMQGRIEDQNQLEDLLRVPSFLGGMIEGIVIKNYDLPTPFGEGWLMAKLVLPQFRELHKSNPEYKKGDIVQEIAGRVSPLARWVKAVNYLRDTEQLLESPVDIGKLMKHVQQDVEEEAEDAIKSMLYNHFRKRILRRCTSGLPEWYRETLLKAQFNGYTETGT